MSIKTENKNQKNSKTKPEIRININNMNMFLKTAGERSVPAAVETTKVNDKKKPEILCPCKAVKLTFIDFSF